MFTIGNLIHAIHKAGADIVNSFQEIINSFLDVPAFYKVKWEREMKHRRRILGVPEVEPDPIFLLMEDGSTLLKETGEKIRAS